MEPKASCKLGSINYYVPPAQRKVPKPVQEFYVPPALRSRNIQPEQENNACDSSCPSSRKLHNRNQKCLHLCDVSSNAAVKNLNSSDKSATSHNHDRNNDMTNGGNENGDLKIKKSDDGDKNDPRSDEECTWEKLYDEDGISSSEDLLHKLSDLGLSENREAVVCVQQDSSASDDNSCSQEDDEVPSTSRSHHPHKPKLKFSRLTHLLEVSQFPSTCTTADIKLQFAQFALRGFDVRWVNDNACIAVFSNALDAEMALSQQQIDQQGSEFSTYQPFHLRKIQDASNATQWKIAYCQNDLSLKRERPPVNLSSFRRHIGHHLRIRLPVDPDVARREKEELEQARRDKRRARRENNEIWEGKV